MKYVTDTNDFPSLEDQLDTLEAIAEGATRANQVVFDKDDDEHFPCCVGCGGFKLVPFFVTDAQCLLGLDFDGPTAVAAAKGGNALSLAAYQCAQRRKEGDESARVEVDVDPQTGELLAFVVGDKEEDMREFRPKSVERNCGSDKACSCGD